MSAELAFKLVELTVVLILAGLLALVGWHGVGAYFKRRNPELFRRPVRPPITAAMEHELLGRDNEETLGLVVGKSYVSGRPMYAIAAAPRAIEESRRS